MKPVFLINILLISSSLFAQTDQSLFERYTRHSEWSYEGAYGPSHWAELDEQFRACSEGLMQSPINIEMNQALPKSRQLDLNYHPFYVDLINNGHTLIEKIVEPRALVFDGVSYTLLQFHFHTPSEHHINQNEYPMEIHFVHINGAKEYAVLAIFFEEKEEKNPFLDHFMNYLPTHVNEKLSSSEKVDPYETIPSDHSFYYYEGSLTTPPCTEGVQWIVIKQPVSATIDQIDAIHKIIHDDNRPIQPRHSRKIYHSTNLSN